MEGREKKSWLRRIRKRTGKSPGEMFHVARDREAFNFAVA